MPKKVNFKIMSKAFRTKFGSPNYFLNLPILV